MQGLCFFAVDSWPRFLFMESASMIELAYEIAVTVCLICAAVVIAAIIEGADE